MNDLDNLIHESKVQDQQERSREQADHNALRIFSNIAYYLGLVLIFASGISFLCLLAEKKDYIGGIFLGCLVGGVNSLFFGMIGKCLIDIYNKITQDK